MTYHHAVHRRRLPRLIDADLFFANNDMARRLIFRFGVEVLRQRKATAVEMSVSLALGNALGREVIEA